MRYVFIFLVFVLISSCDRIVCIKCDDINYKTYREFGIDEDFIENVCFDHKNDIKTNSDRRFCIRYNSINKKLK